MGALRALRADRKADAHRPIEVGLRQEDLVVGERRCSIQLAVKQVGGLSCCGSASFGRWGERRGQAEAEDGKSEDRARDELELGRVTHERGEVLVQLDTLTKQRLTLL